MDTGNEPPVPAAQPTRAAGPHPHDRPHGGTGKFIRSPDTARRDAQAAELRAQGWSFQRIADELGFCDRGEAHHAVGRAMREIVREPAEKLLGIHMDRLETLYAAAVEVLEADHVVVSHGKVITDATGTPLTDHGPKLAAIREARATLDSFWNLTGMKKPAKVEHSGGVKYEVVGIQPEDVV